MADPEIKQIKVEIIVDGEPVMEAWIAQGQVYLPTAPVISKDGVAVDVRSVVWNGQAFWKSNNALEKLETQAEELNARIKELEEK